MAKVKSIKQRPEKFEEKVAIKATFDQTLKVFANAVDKKVKNWLNQSKK